MECRAQSPLITRQSLVTRPCRISHEMRSVGPLQFIPYRKMFFYSRRKINVKFGYPYLPTKPITIYFLKDIQTAITIEQVYFSNKFYMRFYTLSWKYIQRKSAATVPTTDAENKKNRKLPKTSQAIILCLQSDNLKKLNVKQAIRFRI